MILSYSKVKTMYLDKTQIGPFRLGISEEGYYSVTYAGTTINANGSMESKSILSGLLQSTMGISLPENLSHSDAMYAFVDATYNHYTEQFLFANGKVKQSSVHELSRRITHQERWWIYSDILLDKLSRLQTLPDEVLIRLKTITDYSVTPPVTLHFIGFSTGYLNSRTVHIPFNKSMSSLGYVWIEGVRSWISPDQEVIEYNGRKYLASSLTPCTQCGTRVPHLHEGLCQECLGIDPELIVIRNYSERAPNIIPMKIGEYNKSLFSEPLLFGIELEYEAGSINKTLMQTAQLLSHHAIFKRDGSIQEGFEIVTTAATFDHHETVFKNFFEKKPPKLRAASNTGMHIHVSRKPLNMLTQGKLVEFMNREDNRQFIRNIAGREANHFTAIDTSRTITFPFLNHQAARYNTLNINNEHTLEFRIFATPMTWEEFSQRLDFVRAIVSYCSPCQSKATTLKQVTHHDEFEKYVKCHRKDFPYYYQFLFGTELAAKAIKLQAFKLSSATSTMKGAI